MDHIERHYPDLGWLIDMIGFLNPDEQIFSKGFQPKPAKRVTEAHLIADPLGLLQGIPIRCNQSGRAVRLPKTQADARAAMESQLAKLQRKMQDKTLQIAALRQQMRAK